MFNLFKKKEEAPNPISQEFSNVTQKQKMSIMNFLLMVGVCDGEQGNPTKELAHLNTYVNIFGVRSDQCMRYLDAEGQSRMIADLKILSESQKELLIVMAIDMIHCDGPANKTELTMIGNAFAQLGVDEAKIITTMEKTHALMDYFFK